MMLGVPVCRSAESVASSMDQVIRSYRVQLLSRNPPAAETIRKYAEGISKDGTWPDINYADKSMASWKPIGHLNRAREMALALAAGKLSQKDERNTRSAVGLALDNWCAKRYRAPNWFFNEISVPGQMRDIIILLGNDLKGERRKGVTEVMGQLNMRSSGANLMWSAELSLHHGCITGNQPQVEKAAQAIWKEIVIGKRDGIQCDNSFYQHGTRLQTFHYGGGYLGVVCNLAWQLRQTPWAIPQDKRKLISDYILEGPQWMCRGTSTAPGTIDRAASRKGALRGAGLTGQLRLWMEVDPARSQEFKAVIARQEGRGAPLTGYRHFFKSDFTVYHRPAASLFLKTISERTTLTESINSENLKGVPFLSCGDHYVVRDGLEYNDIQPVWQWKFLPGLTMLPEDLKPSRTPFVGGIGNGLSGLTAMDYARASTNGTTLSLRKSWFFHDDSVICLMGGLETVKANGPVVSSLEQCRLRGPVTVRGSNGVARELKPGTYDFTSPRWILHNNIGYIPLNMAGVRVFLGPREGNWNSINSQYPATTVKEPVFQVLADHGKTQGAQGWIIILGAAPKELDILARDPPWRILRNDRDCQAVRFKGGLRMASFFQPGSSGTTKELTVDKPCLAMWTEDRLWLSDPTMGGKVISITWQQKQYTAKVPGGGGIAQLTPADAGKPQR